MDFLDVGADRNDRVLGVALGDGAREIFFDRNEFAEIDAASLVDDPEARRRRERLPAAIRG